MLHSVRSSPFLDGAVPGSFADPLLSFAGRIAGSHALVIAPDGVDLMCRLLRRGCAAAAALRLSERVDYECYDLVIAPNVASSAAIEKLMQQVKRALMPGGRFLAFVPTELAIPEQTAALLVGAIRMGGFVSIQTKATEDGVLVRADAPATGLSHTMPIILRARV